jgi:hypothetical protein
MKQVRRTHFHIILTSQLQIDLLEGSAWFMQKRSLAASQELGVQMLRSHMSAVIKAEAEEKAGRLVAALDSNPLALNILGAACGKGAITPAEAEQVLRRRIPPSLALKMKRVEGQSLPMAPTGSGIGNVPGPVVADPVRSVRGGRKSVLDARETLKSSVAKAAISLLAYTPQKIKVRCVKLLWQSKVVL